MSFSIFSADLKYERPENKGFTLGLLVKNSELNVVPMSDENLNPHCSRSFCNGHNLDKNLIYKEDSGRSAWSVVKSARTYILFIHEMHLKSLLDSLIEYRLLPIEDCLFASSKNRIYSLADLDSMMLNRSHSIGNNKTCNDLLSRLFSKAVVHKLNTKLAGCVAKSLKMSPRFAKSFLSFLESDQRLTSHEQISGICSQFSTKVKVSGTDLKLLLLSMTETNVCLNHSWDRKIAALVGKQCILDDAMNWLSTLGGAYSALGDYDVQFADLAGSTSMEQLRIAMHLASPPLIIRCKLFYSISLIQKKEFKAAKKIIRTQYKAAKALPTEDGALFSMCHGIWNKLRYLWSQDRTHSTNNLKSVS